MASLTALLQQYAPQLEALVTMPDGGVNVSCRLKGQRIKAKCELYDLDGQLVIDLYTILVDGFAVNGNLISKFIPLGKYGPLAVTRRDSKLFISLDGWQFGPSGCLNEVLSLQAKLIKG